jgi:hypothetical protein
MYEAALRIDPTYGPALQNLQILDDETASQ